MRLRNADERIGGIESTISRYRTELEEIQDSLSLKEEQADEEMKQIAAITRMLEQKKARIELLDKEIDSREEKSRELDDELAALSGELKSVIEDLISEVDRNTDTAYSAQRRDGADEAFLAKAEELRGMIRNRIAFLEGLDKEALVSKEITIKDFTRFHDMADELIALYGEYKASIPPIIDSLLSADGLIARKRDIEEREEKARKEGLSNRDAIQKARDEQAILRTDSDSLSAALDQQKEHYRNLLSSIEVTEERQSGTLQTIAEKEAELEDARSGSENDRRSVIDLNDRIKAAEERKAELRNEHARRNSSFASMKDAVSEHTIALQEKRSAKDNAFRDLTEANRILSEQNANISSTDELIQNVVQSFFKQYSRNLGEFEKIIEEEDLPDDTLLLNELGEARNELEKLGAVNPLAEDDYNAAKEQFDFYARHLEDLGKARADLERVLEEIEGKAEELFLRTYNDINSNFQAMFTRLFGGGIAKLTLEDPENVLTSGIEIFAQPPGKKLVTLSLLSGGERSMTAVALLFATYQVKPSPFCILDELDAALDDKNIGYFLDVLTDFGKSSQFIIITHNKHTVTGSETLLGVTQEEAGVSKTISYRLGRVAGQPVIMDDDDSVVDFDSEGRLS